MRAMYISVVHSFSVHNVNNVPQKYTRFLMGSSVVKNLKHINGFSTILKGYAESHTLGVVIFSQYCTHIV